MYALRELGSYPGRVPRPLRAEYPGALYHVTARGVAREQIFREDDDRDLFLHDLAQIVRRYEWLCHAYCLMGNHYHLMVETPATNLSAGLQRLNGVYAQRFNRLYGRVGHLFQGRFHAVIVEEDAYLLELARYVVLNPVRARLCEQPGQWRWSSYRATAGLAAPLGFLRADGILGRLAAEPREAQGRYRRFVAEGLEQNPWEHARGGCLGCDDFVQKFVRRGQTPGSDPGV